MNSKNKRADDPRAHLLKTTKGWFYWKGDWASHHRYGPYLSEEDALDAMKKATEEEEDMLDAITTRRDDDYTWEPIAVAAILLCLIAAILKAFP